MKSNKKFKLLGKQDGFTLVEIVVVIAILAILMSLVSSVILVKIKNARVMALESECMECVATAQTLLVQHQNYGTSFTPKKIAQTAGVSGKVGLVRVSDGVVTHLYYTKGNETYVYSRYYDEVDPATGKHIHQYHLVSYDDELNLISMSDTSDAINALDDLYNINDEYTYVNADLYDDFGVDEDADIYVDGDGDNEGYKDEDPTQPETRETKDTTTTTTTKKETTTEATTVSSSYTSNAGSFYKRIMRYIYDNYITSFGASHDISPATTNNSLPVPSECISYSGAKYVTYSDFYNGKTDYYFMPEHSELKEKVEGNNRSHNSYELDVNLNSGHIMPTTGYGFSYSGLNIPKSLYKAGKYDEGFDKFLEVWHELGYDNYTEAYLSYFLNGYELYTDGNGTVQKLNMGGYQSVLRTAGDASTQGSFNYRIIKFSCNKSNVQEADENTGIPGSYDGTDATAPKVSEGTVVKYNDEYYVALYYCSNTLKWYKFNENDGKSLSS